MEQNASHTARFRKQVKGFYAYLGAVVLAGVAPIAARSLIDSGSLGGRIAGVVFGTIAWMPLITLVGVVIHQGDEFVRRIHLVATAYAFALALVLIALVDWLSKAWFIEAPDLTLLWVAVAFLWVICLFTSKWYFERQR